MEIQFATDDEEDGASTMTGEEVDSEEQKESEEVNDSNQVLLFSVSSGIVIAHILIQSVDVLDGIIVGIALFYMITLTILKCLKFRGFGTSSQEEENLSDVEISKMAYQRGIINEEQFEGALERSSTDLNNNQNG